VGPSPSHGGVIGRRGAARGAGWAGGTTILVAGAWIGKGRKADEALLLRGKAEAKADEAKSQTEVAKVERTKAEEKADEARKQRDRAEAYFEHAQKSIDFFYKLSEELGDDPAMQGVRRRLLKPLSTTIRRFSNSTMRPRKRFSKARPRCTRS